MKLRFLLLPLLLASCVEPPPQLSQKTFRFSDRGPISLAVSNVEVVEELEGPQGVAAQFPTPPAVAMRQWVNDRIRATGGDKRLRVVIKDASVTEVPLPITKGWRGTLKNEPSARYDARLEVEMRIYGERTIAEANVSAIVTRSETLSEKASVAERQALFDRITENLMQAADAELEKNIRMYFTPYMN